MIEAPVELQIPEKAQSRLVSAPTRVLETRTSIKHLPTETKDSTINAKLITQVPDQIMVSEFYQEEYDKNPPTITDIKKFIEKFLPNFKALDWEKDIKPFIASDEMALDQHPYHLESIHFNRHMARVIVFSRIRAEMLGLNKSQKKVVAIAAGYHDTARVNDRRDIGHGKRAADRFLQHIHIYESRGLQLSVAEVEAIKVLCEYHEIDWNEIPGEIKEKYGVLLEALTDGDKADMPRSRNRIWWPKYNLMSPSLRADQEILTAYMEFTKYFTLSNEFERFNNNWTFEEALIKKCLSSGILKEPNRVSPGGILIFSYPESVEQKELIAA